MLAVGLSGCGAPRPLLFDGLVSQAGFSGQVVWAGTGRPVAGALVLIGETEFAAETDDRGVFAFDAVPLGAYTLVVSAPEARGATEPVILAEGLKPDVYIVLSLLDDQGSGSTDNPAAELEALRQEVKRLRAALRQANRRLVQDSEEIVLFERFFLGDDGGGECGLRNPEALTFDARGVGSPPEVLKATAEVLLEVENRRLGYRVLVALDGFSLRHVRRDDSYSMTVEAVFSFASLTPDDAHEAEQWRRNRAEAYRGSLRHFLVALAAGRTDAEGFAVVSRTEVSDSQIYGSSYRYTDDIFVDPATYVSPTGQPLTHWLTFAETIKVLYEDRNVIDKARAFSGIQPGPQASWLALSGQAVAFTAHGHLLAPDGLSVSGYWGVQQVCAMLPRSYNGE